MLKEKRKNMRYVVTVVGLVIAAVGLLLYPPIRSWAAAAGQVESTSGNVWDVRGQQQFRLTSGSVVKPADVIWTGKTGQVRMVMSDDSVVFLGPRSRVRIERYDMGQKGLVAGAFYLLWGKARFLVTKLNSTSASFTVSTQTAIIGVRGTEFGVIVPLPSDISGKESPYTDAMLFKGTIVGTGLKGQTVIMKPGQFTHFTVTHAPEEREMIAQDLQRLDIAQLAPGLIEPNPVQLQTKPVNLENPQTEAPGRTGQPIIQHPSKPNVSRPVPPQVIPLHLVHPPHPPHPVPPSPTPHH